MENSTLELENDAHHSHPDQQGLKMKAVGSKTSMPDGREMSKISSLTSRRDKAMEAIRKVVTDKVEAQEFHLEQLINLEQIKNILENQDFLTNLFSLFDDQSQGYLVQEKWISFLKQNVAGFQSEEEQERCLDLVELIETTSYLLGDESNIHHELFGRIMTQPGVASTLFRLLDVDQAGYVSVKRFLSCLRLIAPNRGHGITDADLSDLKKALEDNIGEKNGITLPDLIKLIRPKTNFFLERVFKVFDKDKSGELSIGEFMESMKEITNQGEDEKVEFLFKIFDINDNGVLYETNVREVIKANMVESGMKFDDNEINDLARALFEDSAKDGADSITVDDLKMQLLRHEGLLRNLTTNIDHWFVPRKPQPKKPLSEKLTMQYWVNNKEFVGFIIFLCVINITLFVTRSYYFKDFKWLNFGLFGEREPNMLYVISRGCGKVLLFNSAFIIVFVSRHTLTFLRGLGLSSLFPIDHSIYLHKCMGWAMFGFAWIHTICHLINFGINIQPNPVRFVQQTAPYWREHTGEVDSLFGFLDALGYEIPPGCSLIDTGLARKGGYNITLAGNESILGGVIQDGGIEDCNEDDQIAHYTHLHDSTIFICQVCSNESGAQQWTYFEWIFTARPGILGAPRGLANPTGVSLILIFTVMTIFSLPCVRRSGNFQVFYFTHMLYFFYWILLLIHAPIFWTFFIIPGSIFFIENTYRIISGFVGKGKTKVSAGVIYPSKVTHLEIKRPARFNFNVGDWVFLKVPDVAHFEWHAFTISSAPEVRDTFSVDIRGVGNWTNSLYQLFKEDIEGKMARRNIRPLKKIRQSFRKKNSPQLKRVRIDSTSEMVELAHGQENNLNRGNNLLYKKSMNRSIRYLRNQSNTVLFDTSDDTSDLHEVEVDPGDENYSGKGECTRLETPLKVFVDGPYGAPASNFYRAEHAVMIATGIGVTPFASILQSIMHRYKEKQIKCPNCEHKWTTEMGRSMEHTKKVDFFWINKDQQSFEWFVTLLSQLEIEQAELGGAMARFLDMHLYVTSALDKTNMKAVMLQLALDLKYQKDKRDLLTGLQARTNTGRPNWGKVFAQIRAQNHGKVTVFFCGNPLAAEAIKKKCTEFNFKFKKEVF